MEGYYVLLKYKNRGSVPLGHAFFKNADSKTKKAKLKELRQAHINNEVEVFCCCRKPNIQMSLPYFQKTDTYSLRTFPKKAHLHKEDCYFSLLNGDSSFSSNSTYQSGYSEKNGITEVNLDSQAYSIQDILGTPATRTISTFPKSEVRNPSTSYAKPSIFSLTKRLVTEAWNDSIKYAGNKNYPTSDKTIIFSRLSNYTLRKYSVNKVGLKDIFYNGVKTGRVQQIEKKFKTAAFTILLLEDWIEKTDDGQIILDVRSPLRKESHKVCIKSTLFQNALKKVNGIPGPYFIGGFLTNTGYEKPPKFLSFCLVPISDYGTPIESSYERELYNQLAEEHRKVIRPTVHTIEPEWNGFIPDGLLIDTTPPTILEVFGMSEAITDYHEERLLKMKHFSNLKPRFSFWYWDAYKRSPISKIPPL